MHALADESSFVAHSPVYGPIAGQMGTSYLTKRLSTLLLQCLQDHLPTVKVQLTKAIQETEQELQSYSHPLGSVSYDMLYGSNSSNSSNNSNDLDSLLSSTHSTLFDSLQTKHSDSSSSSSTKLIETPSSTTSTIPKAHLGPILLELLSTYASS